MDRPHNLPRVLFFALSLFTIVLAACTGDTARVVTPTGGARQASATPAVDLQATVTALAAENTRLSGLLEQLSATPTQAPPTEVPPTATASPEPTAPAPAAQQVVCPVYICSGLVVWEVTSEGFTFTPSPDFVQLAYDYTPTTQRLLYADKFPDHGRGPANISVTNLLAYDLKSGDSQVIFQDEVIAKAIWAPDGQTIAFILATEDTYELHLRQASGEDRVLAKDVAFVFSFSPTGSQIAFTRESRYSLPGKPGLYIVDIASGQERQVSDVDRAGYGSISDFPLWSPDEKYIILSASNVNTPTVQMLIATDGSGSGPLTFGELISPDRVGQTVGTILLWHPDGIHVVALESVSMFQDIGSQRIAYYRLNLAKREIAYAQTVVDGDFRPISWSVPGESFWIHSGQYQILLAPVPAQEFPG